MSDFLSKIQFEGETFLTSFPHFLKKDIYSMCSDEIILHMDDLRLHDIEYIQKRIAESPLDLRMEQYTIGKIAGTDVFVKILLMRNGNQMCFRGGSCFCTEANKRNSF